MYRVVRAPDLKSGVRGFKSRSDHLATWSCFSVDPSSAPRICLYIANWSASLRLGFLSLLRLVDIFVSFISSGMPVNQKNTKAKTDTTQNDFLKVYYISAGQTSFLQVPEEGWFGQPKYSTPSKNHSTLCRYLLLYSSFYM